MERLFDRKRVLSLMLPLIAEQILLSLMGSVDTLMIAGAGKAAVSAVSLVNSLNVVIIRLFSAVGVGGSIIVSQLVGARDLHGARSSSRQLMLVTTRGSAAVALICVVFRTPLLRLLFGNVEPDVMEGASVYFLITAFSFPFISMSASASAVYRAGGNSRLPMLVNVGANLLNVAGNAVMIYGLKLGILGAAVPTLLGRIFAGLALAVLIRKPERPLHVRGWFFLKTNWKRVREMMRIGLPAGVESGLFELGKLTVQSMLSGLGTTAIAANAIVAMMESFSSKASDAVYLALMTIVGTCVGAGCHDEAKEHTKRLCLVAELALAALCALSICVTLPVTRFSGLDEETASLAFRMTHILLLLKPIPHTFSFGLSHALRGAGDVKYSMTVSVVSMWFCRVLLTWVLYRFAGQGPMSMWWGMFTDWCVRGLFFLGRCRFTDWTHAGKKASARA